MADFKGGDRGKGLFQQKICIGEELKLAVTVALDKFRNDEVQKELEFPTSLTAKERAFVHRYCHDAGLKTKSRGKANKRFLTAFKKETNAELFSNELVVSKEAIKTFDLLLGKFPLTGKDKHELSKAKSTSNNEQNKITSKDSRFALGQPQVPPKAKPPSYKLNNSLPIQEQKQEILDAINENQVILIAGETGSGKTTQVYTLPPLIYGGWGVCNYRR